MTIFYRPLLPALLCMLALDACDSGHAIQEMAAMPGQAVPTRALNPDAALVGRLEQHVSALARERNTAHLEALNQTADYIEKQLRSYGYQVDSQWYTVAGVSVRNLGVSLQAASALVDKAPLVVVGAHYDSARGAPGADDNASGTAAALELARAFRDAPAAHAKEIRFVFFTNEEPPYFRTREMGSYRYAEQLAAQNVQVEAMLAFDMLGAYCDKKGCQRYPFPQEGIFPDRGDFIAFAGNLESGALTRKVVGIFRSQAAVPSQGISAPAGMEGIDQSDHASFWAFGYPALLVSDTSFFRYPHYHTRHDTLDKLDFRRMAGVVEGLAPVIRELAK